MNEYHPQEPIGGSSPKPEEPIVVEHYAVNDSQSTDTANASGFSSAGGSGNESSANGGKNRFPAKLVALCLSCALLGGVGGGALVGLTQSGSGGTSVMYEGVRPQVRLEQVSTDDRKPLTVPEIYANYADSCVGISVDIVSTNLFGQTVKGAAAGSGFVITEDGYIVTNYHVVQDANAITVSFMDGTSYAASYIGGDAANDIAVLKIEATGLKPVVIGDSDNLYVGETVATIGNPLGELTFSLSDGVISALDRSITLSDGTKMNMLQTNCAINSGNSGGPLFNAYGEVIGIVSAKYSTPNNVMPGSETASVEGLGFAIPLNDVKDMITDLIEKGYISGQPYLGITVLTVNESAQRYGIPAGAEVIYATPGLAAAKAGIQEGDIITAVDDVEITSNVSLIDANNEYKAGDQVNCTIFRKGETLVVPVTLDEKTTKNVEAHTAYADKRGAEDAANSPDENPEIDQYQVPNEDEYHYFTWPEF